MTSDEAFANLQSAMQDYASARKGLDLHRGLAKHGIPNELAYAVAAEHSALHRLDRAQKAYAALQPAATTKATPAPAPLTTPPAAPVTPARVTAPTANASFDLLDYLNDRCRESEARVNALYGLSPRTRS